MSKETGLGANLYLDQFDLSNDANSVDNISKALNPLEVTGIDKSAIERKAGLLTGQITSTVIWNPTNAHIAISTLPRTDRQVSYFHRATLGAPVASMVAKQVEYAPERDNAGLFTAEVDTLSNGFWLDWGYALTAGIRQDTVATTPASGVDFSIQDAPAAFGAQFYLHVFTFVGTSATITIQDSADNVTFANLTGGGFTVVTAATKERIATGRTQAVRRYMRVITTGTFSSLRFAVSGTVNTTDMTI